MENQKPRTHVEVRLGPTGAESRAEDLRAALLSEPRSIPSRYFYDSAGSALFERITALPEYYLTRAEAALLAERSRRIAELADPVVLVELGSGAATKTRILLDAMSDRRLARYVPLDVDEEGVRHTADELAAIYPRLEIHGVVGDFMTDLDSIPAGEHRLIAFLGSTIGNFDSAETLAFLRRLRAVLGPTDSFLLGVDLVKDSGRLEAAYNDEAGITAAFNLNILKVINRRFDADFHVGGFIHRAFFDRRQGWIEMRLVSQREQTVRVGALGLELKLEEGEEIRTEISTKYTPTKVAGLLAASGFEPRDWFEHESGFALVLARTAAT